MTKGILGRKVGMTKVFDSRNGYRNVGLNKQGKSRPFKCTPAPSATSPVASRVGTVFKKRAERLHPLDSLLRCCKHRPISKADQPNK